jgi:hypothetical protein
MLTAVLASPAWTGSEGARHLPDDRAQAALPTSVLPFSLTEFFLRYYDRTMLRLNHTQTGFDPEQVWQRSDLAANVEAIVSDGKARTSGVIKPYMPNKKDSKYQLPENVGATEAVTLLQEQMMAGVSFVLAFEKVSASRRPMKWLNDALFAVTGIPSSIHLYASAPGAQVLPPHTDPYDVLVWQLTGSKSWRACVPREELGSRTFNVSRPLSDAQRCLLQELVRDNIGGCTSYTVEDAASLACEDFTMAPGDVIYMPKGVVHHARTHPSEEPTFHLTIGLHRKNMQWLDVVTHIVEKLPLTPPAAAAGSSGGGGVGVVVDALGAAMRLAPPAPPAESTQREAFVHLLTAYSTTAEGVHMHETVPGWLLHCYRPEHLVHARFDGAPSCAERTAELRRIFELHMDQLGASAGCECPLPCLRTAPIAAA